MIEQRLRLRKDKSVCFAIAQWICTFTCLVVDWLYKIPMFGTLRSNGARISAASSAFCLVVVVVVLFVLFVVNV
jgi:hypothetical protein